MARKQSGILHLLRAVYCVSQTTESMVRYLVKVLNFPQYSVYDFSLGPLVNKVKEFQVETIVEALCGNMVSEKEQLRDISSIGLKTVISELPLASSTLAASVCKRITGKLSSAIEKVSLTSWSAYALQLVVLSHSVEFLHISCCSSCPIPSTPIPSILSGWGRAEVSW